MSCEVDGKRLFSYRDGIPFPGDQLGFYAWAPGAHLRPLEVRRLRAPAPLKALDLADRLFLEGAFEAAAARYEEIAAECGTTFDGLLARFRRGMCLGQLERRDDERAEFEHLKGTPLEPYALVQRARREFEDRPEASRVRGTELLEDVLARFPASEARFQIYGFVGMTRSRTVWYGPNRAEDLQMRARLNDLGAQAQRPATQQQIRCQMEWARVYWQLGRWKEAFDKSLAFRDGLAPVQFGVASFHNIFMACALSVRRDEVLPASPYSFDGWETVGNPDWCSGILGHCVIRRDNPEVFLNAAMAHVQAEPGRNLSFEFLQAVFFLRLALGQEREAAEWLEKRLVTLGAYPDLGTNFPPFWIGGMLAEARQEALFERWTAHLSKAVLNAGTRSPLARTLALLKGRWAIEGRKWEQAAVFLKGWSEPELEYHFSDGLVLQALLASLGLLKELPQEKLLAACEHRLASVELALARIFLGLDEPRVSESWPDPGWRPEWRLWLALWLEQNGKRESAREIASASLDARYGQTHSQPALNALVKRLS